LLPDQLGEGGRPILAGEDAVDGLAFGHSSKEGFRRWETGRATQAGTRYGCFLPDLTGLARSLSVAGLPTHYIRRRPVRCKRLDGSGEIGNTRARSRSRKGKDDA